MTDSAAAAPPSSSSPLPPLPPGWTQNKAPSGHTYYYNTQTKESTYRRPVLPPPPPPAPPVALPPQPAVPVPHRPPFPGPPQQPYSYGPQGGPQGLPAGPQAPPQFLRLSDPRVANAFMAQQNAAASAGRGDNRGGYRGGRGGGRGGQGNFQNRPRPQPKDKPRSRIAIPGCEPWVLVYTKYGRRFVFNPDKNASYWRIPEKLMPAILELDKAGIRPGTEAWAERQKAAKEAAQEGEGTVVPLAAGADDNSEYEEVEATDDEDREEEDGGRRKRQRTDDQDEYDEYGGGGGPIEFSEADIAFQLQAAAGGLGDEYDGDEGWDGEEGGGDGENGDYEGDGDAEDYGAAQFKALLDDFQINPFSAWEKLIEEGKVFDDPRYTALPTMKARKAVWEEWSIDRIRAKKEEEQKKKEAAAARPVDPRAPYLQLLQDHATPKLYWPEFKRKFRKEAAMKDVLHPPDKEKEKLYRDFVARRKLPAATRKADLTELLHSLPRSALNNQTPTDSLPIALTGDLRYVAVEPAVRDALVEAFLRTAGPPE